MFKKIYVMEPRLPDGELDSNVNMVKFPKRFITGATEDQIFQYYFSQNPNTGSFATKEQVTEWYRGQGLVMRRKTW